MNIFDYNSTNKLFKNANSPSNTLRIYEIKPDKKLHPVKANHRNPITLLKNFKTAKLANSLTVDENTVHLDELMDDNNEDKESLTNPDNDIENNKHELCINFQNIEKDLERITDLKLNEVLNKQAETTKNDRHGNTNIAEHLFKQPTRLNTPRKALEIKTSKNNKRIRVTSAHKIPKINNIQDNVNERMLISRSDIRRVNTSSSILKQINPLLLSINTCINTNINTNLNSNININNNNNDEDEYPNTKRLNELKSDRILTTKQPSTNNFFEKNDLNHKEKMIISAPNINTTTNANTNQNSNYGTRLTLEIDSNHDMNNSIETILNDKKKMLNLYSECNKDIKREFVRQNSKIDQNMIQNYNIDNKNDNKKAEFFRKQSLNMPSKLQTTIKTSQIMSIRTKRLSSPKLTNIGTVSKLRSNTPHIFINTNINLNNNLKSNENKKQNEPKILDGFLIEKVIGNGSYAVVRIASDENTNIKYAIKTYDKFKLFDINRRKNLRREISILSTLNHPNIIKLHRTIDTPSQIHLVMEYIGNMSLYQYLKTKPNRKLEENEARILFRQIVHGIAYCHQKNICHRDIKLENILVNEHNHVKIIDFGFSVITPKDKLLNLYCGTPTYMSPELVNKKEYFGHLADSWALGVSLYLILCGKYPFKGTDEKDLGKKISKGTYEIPEQLSTDAQALLEKLLKVNPFNRATIEGILNDKWINGDIETPILVGNYFSKNGKKTYIDEKKKACDKTEDITNLSLIRKIHRKFWNKYKKNPIIFIANLHKERALMTLNYHYPELNGIFIIKRTSYFSYMIGGTA